MIEPSNEQRDRLSDSEKFYFDLAETWQRHFRGYSVLHNSTVMVGVTWLTVARRLRYHGLEHVRSLDFDRGILMVCNHRSFFDFFTVMCALFNEVPDFPRRLLFPVRSTFFYQRPLGTMINFCMSGLTMFPPIGRRNDQREWNVYAMERCVDELENNKMVVGVHPEGSRNKDLDPFTLKKGRPGVGRIALGARESQVLPVFITGLSNDPLEELRRNWLEPERYPIYLAFGTEVDLSDLRDRVNERTPHHEVTERCMEAIAQLALTCKELWGDPNKESAAA